MNLAYKSEHIIWTGRDDVIEQKRNCHCLPVWARRGLKSIRGERIDAWVKQQYFGLCLCVHTRVMCKSSNGDDFQQIVEFHIRPAASALSGQCEMCLCMCASVCVCMFLNENTRPRQGRSQSYETPRSDSTITKRGLMRVWENSVHEIA